MSHIFLAGHRGEVRKIRRPKAEIRKNSEVRGPEASVGPSDGLLGTGRSRVFRRWPKPARRAGSGFGHRISVGFRISSFGFQRTTPQCPAWGDVGKDQATGGASYNASSKKLV